MVYLWSGKTGSGKTFRMCKKAFRYWLNGIDVYSNIQLLFYFVKGFSYAERFGYQIKVLWCQIFRIPLKPLRRGQIWFFDNITEIFDARDGLIVFDDAGVLFNSKSWEAMPIEFVYKLQLQRHHKLDMFATVPNIKSVHIDYRRLVQKWYYCKVIFRIGSDTKEWFGLHSIEEKDVDEITIVEDDNLATTIKTRYFFIHAWKRRLYDTLADIAFRRYKIIWISHNQDKQCWIIPKEQSLKDAIRYSTLLQSTLHPKIYRAIGKTRN